MIFSESRLLLSKRVNSSSSDILNSSTLINFSAISDYLSFDTNEILGSRRDIRMSPRMIDTTERVA